MARTARAVAEFVSAARAEGAEPRAFATAAVRSAANGGEFCALVRKMCGVELDVVSGREEADLALAGALGKGEGSVIDIGGASTEFCTRRGGKRGFSVSLDIGAVRLFDLCRDERARLLSVISEALSPVCGVFLPAPVYAVGGTATTLAAIMQGLDPYDGDKINDFPMERGAVSALAERLLALPAAERVKLRGMDARRADIIAGGAFLLSCAMEQLGLDRVFASDRDNLEGYLYTKIL